LNALHLNADQESVNESARANESARVNQERANESAKADQERANESARAVSKELLTMLQNLLTPPNIDFM